MIKIENVPWNDLCIEEKRVFEICRSIITWTHKDKTRLNFCESLRLIDEATDLFERFSRQPFFHRRQKLIEYFWDAESLRVKFNEAKKIYEENICSLSADLKSAANAIIAMAARITDYLEDVSICHGESGIKFVKVWREDEDWIEICVKHPVEPDTRFLITLNEMFCFRGGTASPPHLLDFLDYLKGKGNLGKSVDSIDFSELKIERYDHTHDDPDDALIQKFISIARIKDEKDLEIILNTIAQRIVDTPRVFNSGVQSGG